jgi:hypothetical protein
VLAAYVVVRHGPVYAPLVDRLERELEAAQWNDPTERAKRILEAYGADGMQKRFVPRRVVSRESDADPNAFGGLPGGMQRSRERNPRN